MRVCVARDEVVRGVQCVSRAIDNSKTIEVLRGIMLEANGGSVSLCATDLERQISIVLRNVEVSKPGKAVVGGKVFVEVAARTAGETMVLELEEGKLRVTCGEAIFELPTFPVEDFPGDTFDTAALLFEVSREELVDGLQWALVAAANQGMTIRPLDVVCFGSGGDSLELVATDGYRMAVKTVGVTSRDAWEDFLVPEAAVRDLMAVLRQVEAESVEVWSAATSGRAGERYAAVMFRCSDVEFYVQTDQRDYVDYRELLQRYGDGGDKARFERRRLLGALKRLAVTADKDSRKVTFGFRKDDVAVTLNAESRELGKGEETVPLIAPFPRDLQIAFNVTYLAQALGKLPCDDVTLTLRGSEAAAVLRPNGEEAADRLYIVMPVRL